MYPSKYSTILASLSTGNLGRKRAGPWYDAPSTGNSRTLTPFVPSSFTEPVPNGNLVEWWVTR